MREENGEKRELKEKISRILGLRYVEVDGNFVTQTGVIFSFDEVSENTEDNIRRMYKERLTSGDVYDYNYAKSTGFLRRKRGYFIIEDQDNSANEKSIASVLGFGAIYFFLVIALMIVGTGAIYISFKNTAQYLRDYFDPFRSMILSFTMIVFATSAFEVALILWINKISRAMPVLLLFLWVCVTIFSMNSTMAVNYSGYQTRKQQSMESRSQENSGRLLLPVIKGQIETTESQIKIIESSIANYIAMDNYSEWRASEMRKELSSLVAERNRLVEEQKDILLRTPDAVLIEDTHDRTYFDAAGEITGIKPETVSFVLNAFPAVFIDLIAPFSFAAALMLLNNKKKKGA